MTIVPGLLALAMLGAEGPPGPHDGAVATQLRILEMDGLDWREGVHGDLQFVAQQGSATIWTAGKAVVTRLNDAADQVVAAPGVTSQVEEPTTIAAHKVRHYVAHLGRDADGPVGRATYVKFQPYIRPIQEGIEAKLACRPVDQGVLVRIAIDDTSFIALHTATFTESLIPDEAQRAKGVRPTSVSPTYQVPEVSTCRVAGEWLIPKEGVLIISLGARTVPGASTVFGTRATVRERVAVIEARPIEAPPVAPALPLPAVAANRPLPVAPPGGLTITGAAVAPLPVPPALPFVADAPPPYVVDRLYHLDSRSRVIHGAPLEAPPSDPALCQVGHIVMPMGVSMLPIVPAGSIIAAPAVLPVPPTPVQAVPPQVTAPTDRQLSTASAPAEHEPKTYADIVSRVEEAPLPAGTPAPEARKQHPTPPSRVLPQPIAADGTPMALPPLPDETAEALAKEAHASGSAEPRPSPQSRTRRPANAATALASAGTGTVELKGRVTIRTEDGLVIEADSIVLRPAASRGEARSDGKVQTTSATVPAATPARIPAFAPEPPPACPHTSDQAPPIPQDCPTTSRPCPDDSGTVPDAPGEGAPRADASGPRTSELGATMTHVVTPDGVHGVDFDYDVRPARLDAPATAPGSTRLLSYRLPVGRGAIELKVRIQRVTRPVTAQP